MTRFHFLKPTAADVRAYRDAHECSTFEAKAAVRKRWLQERLAYLRKSANEISSVDECQDILCEVIEYLQETCQ